MALYVPHWMVSDCVELLHLAYASFPKLSHDATSYVLVKCSALAAGARVHGGKKDKVDGKSQTTEGAVDRQLTFFQRLAEDLERSAVELGHLVEGQDALVGHQDWPGCGGFPPPTSPASLTLWCGVQKGRTAIRGFPGCSRPMVLSMRVVSRLSAGVNGGRIVGGRLASGDFPVPADRS